MKKILFSLILISKFATGQDKGANTIVIPNITMEKAVNLFRDNGYMIGAITSEVVSTIPQKSPNGIKIVFEIDIKDSTGYLKGTYDGHPIVPGLWDFSESYAGHYKGGSFKIMDNLAKAFGLPVSYAKL